MCVTLHFCACVWGVLDTPVLQVRGALVRQTAELCLISSRLSLSQLKMLQRVTPDM